MKGHVPGQAGITPVLLLYVQPNGKWGYPAQSKAQLCLLPCSGTLAEPLGG